MSVRDPAYALQKAVYQAIIATGAVDGRVYSEVPAQAVKPFVQIGDDFIVSNREAGEFHVCTAVVNVVAASKGKAKEIAGIIRAALEAPIEIDGFMVCEYEMPSSIYRIDNDCMTAQASLEFDYLLQTVE